MYLSYFQAVGVPLCVYALFLFLCQQVASFCHGYWLSLWADDPTVDGQQTQAALRGSIFGILGCLQGTPRPPSSQPPSEVLRAPWPAHTWLTLPFMTVCANLLGPNASFR